MVTADATRAKPKDNVEARESQEERSLIAAIRNGVANNMGYLGLAIRYHKSGGRLDKAAALLLRRGGTDDIERAVRNFEEASMPEDAAKAAQRLDPEIALAKLRGETKRSITLMQMQVEAYKEAGWFADAAAVSLNMGNRVMAMRYLEMAGLEAGVEKLKIEEEDVDASIRYYEKKGYLAYAAVLSLKRGDAERAIINLERLRWFESAGDIASRRGYAEKADGLYDRQIEAYRKRGLHGHAEKTALKKSRMPAVKAQPQRRKGQKKESVKGAFEELLRAA